MRFDECNHQNEWFALMSLDEITCVFLEKLWPRQLDWEIADGYFRESAIRFVWRKTVSDQVFCVIPVIFLRNQMIKSASDSPVLARGPFANESFFKSPPLH